MIITFWMNAYCLLDTPEQRLRLEARRMANAIKKLYVEKNTDKRYTNDESRNY